MVQSGNATESYAQATAAAAAAAVAAAAPAEEAAGFEPNVEPALDLARGGARGLIEEIRLARLVVRTTPLVGRRL